MLKRKDDLPIERILAFLERHWKIAVFASWLAFAAWFVVSHWASIRIFTLPDTDDNMRLMQVRALLHGQDWFDLRQYRLNPPVGANIHWSRLVDLPLAGLILALRPFVGGPSAELIAVAVAPILPYLLLLYGLALTARRLIHHHAFALPVIAMIVAGLTNSMFMPGRIDHHGWQLALLAMSIAGLSDPKRVRGGVTLGITTALSLAIGLEMIIYLAIAGAAVALYWVADPGQRRRAIAYAAGLGGGVTFCFLVFASYANRLAVCDALSPVWLSDLLLSAALLLGMAAFVRGGGWTVRLALCAGAGAIVAGFHAFAWPQCLGRLEGVSPEVYKLWLSHVREARPVYANSWRVAVTICALPVTGAFGWMLLAWHNRDDEDLLMRTLAVAATSLAAMMLLLWQTRVGPAAQMLATVGAVAIVWVLAPIVDRGRHSILRVLAVTAVALIGFGAIVPLGFFFAPSAKLSATEAKVERANRACSFIGSFRAIGEQPKGTIFTWVDISPRLIVLTHHDSIMGPYHRNGEQIADTMNAFRGSADQAHRLFDKYHSDYLLTCPYSSSTTIFTSEAPKGFYAQLAKGEVPKWLTPVKLPDDSPFRMWKITPEK